MKRTSLIFVVGVLILIGFVAYGGLKFWQKSSAESDLTQLNASLIELRGKVLQYENQKITEAIAAKQTLEQFANETVLWSRIIKILQKTIPEKDDDSLVQILSYSGSNNSDISISVKTVPGSEEPYLDVADLIEAFDESEDFDGSFVPSISDGLTDEGEQVLSFSFNTKYMEEPKSLDPEALQSALGDILEESLEDEPVKR